MNEELKHSEFRYENPKKISESNEIFSTLDVTLAEDDEVKRDVLIKQIVKQKVTSLSEQAIPMAINGFNTKKYEGFIHPNSTINRFIGADSFKTDDESIYEELINSRNKYKKDPRYSAMSNEQSVPYIVNDAITQYFGNAYSTETTESVNRQFYENQNDDFSISKLKGKGISVCAEKAATAQNMLVFLGLESTLIQTSGNKLTPSGSESSHAYLLIKYLGHNHLYDPTNPIIVKNPEGKILGVFPAIYKLTEEQNQSLLAGEKVKVLHSNLVLDRNDYCNGEQFEREYQGPK